MTTELSASLEDYMEAIYHVVQEKGAARPSDIAARMAVSRPSVTGALRSLVKEEMVFHKPYDVINFTKQGEKVARQIVKKHEVLKEFFTGCLGVNERDAEEAACGMEHTLSQSILQRLVEFVEMQRAKKGRGKGK